MSFSRSMVPDQAQSILSPRALCCVGGRSGGTLGLHPEAPGAAPHGGGLDVRSNPFVSLFAASLIALLPAHAFAQNTTPVTPPTTAPAPQTTAPDAATPAPNPNNSVSVRNRARPELDPQGARVGGFTLHASLGLDVTSTDNLFAAPSGSEEDDIIYVVSPDLRLTSNWSRHRLQFSAGGASRMHDDFDSEDVDTYYVNGAGRLDITADTAINASAAAAHEFTPRTDPDLTVAGAPVEYDRTDASLGVLHRFGRFTARLDGSQTERQYDGVESVRDYEQTSLRARADVELSPRIGLLVEAIADERDYDDDAATPLDSEGQTWLVGATLHGNLMQGEVSVGQFERDYDNPAIGTVDGVAVAGELEWYITQLTTITLTARRGSEDNATTGTVDPYVATEYGARIDHELLRNLILTAGVRAGDREYEDEVVGREDDYVSYDVGADYILNRRVAVAARYRHDEVDSNVGRTFDVNAVTVGLRLRL